MDRRAFIKVTAVTGTSATLASCGNPEHQIIRFMPGRRARARRGRVEAEPLSAVPGRLRRDRARHGGRRRGRPRRPDRV